MILQALTSYYEALCEKGELARPGWDSATKICWALELNEDGTVEGIYPLKQEVPSGKKTRLVARQMKTPVRLKASVAIIPNFLWDNSGYFLGFDEKGKPERTQKCFAASAAFHKQLLGDVPHPAAKAICAFFDGWDTTTATENPKLQDALDGLYKSENIAFMVNGVFAMDVPEIRDVWQAYYDSGMGADQSEQSTQAAQMTCLVTGKKAVPEATHPFIKGVQGAQSSGAAMVSFNAPSFTSYGREQNLNAPVSKEAAFAYTAALNYLLGKRDGDGYPRFSKRIGDMTVVFWAEDANEVCQDITSLLLDGGDEETIANDDLMKLMQSLAQGQLVSWNGAQVNPSNKFYVLGLSPNAARLSVRFFHQSSFGEFVRNIAQHYERLDIVRPSFEKWKTIPLWKLLDATVCQNATDKTPHKQMAGDTLAAILSGSRYPATLFQQTMLRARAESAADNKEKAQKAKNASAQYVRTAIVKAYLLRNEAEKYKEVLTVELNETTTYQPYILGRIFSVLEEIQEKANPGINTTIKDRYFTSASATPANVFPSLLNLAQNHLAKIDGTYFDKKLGNLMAMLTESYPKHLSLYDQGVFQLGYYHQNQKRYETKTKAE